MNGENVMWQKNDDIDALFGAILSLENIEECYMFFEDILTRREAIDIAQRLRAARMLREGNSYQEVCTELKMSSATLSRVSKALEGGAGGYKLVLSRIEEQK